MMPAPMKPSLAGVGEVSAAMVATERVERTWGRTVVEDRLLSDVDGVRVETAVGRRHVCANIEK